MFERKIVNQFIVIMCFEFLIVWVEKQKQKKNECLSMPSYPGALFKTDIY